MRPSRFLPLLATLACCAGIHGPVSTIIRVDALTSVLAAEQPAFTDVTGVSGVATLVDDHYAAHPQWWLSGLHLVDLDADGDLNLFLSSHGRGTALAALGDVDVSVQFYPSGKVVWKRGTSAGQTVAVREKEGP